MKAKPAGRPAVPPQPASSSPCLGSKGNLQDETEVTDIEHSVEATTLYFLFFSTSTSTSASASASAITSTSIT